jgi:hypothetical protein
MVTTADERIPQAASARRNVARLEPQIAEHRRSEPEKHQADQISCPLHADEQLRERLQLIRVERPQVIGPAQEPQGCKIVQHDDRENGAFGEPPERRKEGDVPVDGLQMIPATLAAVRCDCSNRFVDATVLMLQVR